MLALTDARTSLSPIPVIAGSIHLSSWRVYIMLSTFPAISAAFFLIFLPESPSFLFTKNKLQKTLNALAYIARLNRYIMFIVLCVCICTTIARAVEKI